MKIILKRTKSPILILFFICLVLLLFNLNEDPFKRLILDDAFLSCFAVLTIIVSTITIQLVIIFGMEYYFGSERKKIFHQLQEYFMTYEILLYVILVDVALGLFCYFTVKFEVVETFAIIIIFSTFFACLDLLFEYDNYDLASSQNSEKSIGALWAYGAYTAFYKKILFDLIQRITEFEKERDIKFLTKKLILICPLSCNATGTLDNKDSEISKEGNLRNVIDDEGANLDRRLTSTVYCINKQSRLCIAAEMPSPLATLWEIREMIDDVILKYHRDCFIHTLRDLLKSHPCIILEYDDLNKKQSEGLHDFLLTSLNFKRTKAEKEV
ncbi:uncharacterized protein NPIL_638751 [Nephila pilipes]|uniref:STING ligand-binding domain-containing protein n=1 Tax=Nephila pilipes TaxID=299642 RepID=A0A8X6NNS2_NEPPI|nr:uncharacterized protein NPIL_638751 [Nephila pilipes]